MSSKREEERNEKIIRGLMKLPPNRRCINCNSLGPQYVCINFWTFVCITCSGIHREFTHRVKSVSMSKFTSQEVESLQNGGNQRAKELFLKDWDFERQRLPSGNNIEKIREFIKNVYVDRKYAGGKSSEKPPRDVQSHRKNEAETRRASSYHSYSQSPPYDFQYEERRNRKQGVMLTRKPGSDRGLYEDKVSGLYSPGRYSDHMTEERFTIERTSSRVSDYSVSSGGDPIRSHPQSPNSVKDSGFNSPSFVYSKESHADDSQHQTGNTNIDIHVRNEGVTVANAQIMGSSTTDGDSSKASFNSANFASFADFSQFDQPSVMSHQNKIATVPSSSQAFAPVNTSTVDLFKEPHEKHPVNPVSSSDLLQSPAMPSLVDLFQMTSDSPASTGNMVSSHTSLSSLSFFEESSQSCKDTDLLGAAHSGPAPNNLVSSHTSSFSSLSLLEEHPQNSSAMNMGAAHSESATNNLVSSHTPALSPLSFFDEISQDSSAMNVGVAHSDSVPNDVGWANFDFPQHTSTSKSHDFADVAEHSGTGASIGNFSSLSTSHASIQWPEFVSSTAHGAPPLMSNSQHEILPINPVLGIASNSQDWRPFDDVDKQGRGVTVLSDKPSTADHFVDSIDSADFYKGRSQSTSSFGPVPGLPLDVIDESFSVDQPAAIFMGEPHSHFERNTSNPFDVSYEADLGASNMFYDMSTLHAALPSTDLPSSFAGVMNDSWFLHEAANPGGISYMAAQAQSSQLPNVQTHGPVASVGGNPFA